MKVANPSLDVRLFAVEALEAELLEMRSKILLGKPV
jgi:hypothetical protein